MRSARAVAVLLLASVAAGGCGDEAPRVPSDPGPGEPHFGYNEDWLTRSDLFELAADSGADTVRYNLSWSVIEPEPGEYDWEQFDLVYEEALDQGLEPILILVNAPCWASGLEPDCDPSLPVAPLPDQLDAWSSFAAAAAARYPKARGLEIWNEPNLKRFWEVGPLSPERYADLLVAAYDAIKEVAPELPVLTAGLLPAGESDAEKMAYAEFLGRTLAAGGSGHFDAVGVHPYPFFSDVPSKRVGAVLNNVREVLRQAGEPGTPLWITEVGISTSGPDPFTPEAQAEALAGIYEYVSDQPDVPVLIFHRFIDVAGIIGAREAGWGVITSSEAIKPAFCAIARLRGLSAC